ncbi:hypothetical protein K432DRAFT_329816 [Lepidopterella palustris CBS 459.81]|uniref:Transcription factor IIIC putative zinc-finger domain-containing protein n=1 Tax=Lepidopterella palustris CBS 459.81 TaxID=1314670 RepID=A0A8E2E962_9PEZI|nr:hypothetical protein K432DRAFT_329816 [Lepidopterella palustris CBS 459.81]
MSGVTTLNSWPSCLNSLTWSQDCEIAIAAGEHVQILIPNLDALNEIEVDTSHRASLWHNITLQTNLWTKRELPVKEPATFRNFSIGEELSLSTVAAIEWSPPGMAKHRRCALAILTSNLLLSIWEADSNPRKTTSWKRVLIVNHVLDRYFAGIENDDAETEWEENQRLRQSVRAFSWSPPTSDSRPASTIGTRLSWGAPLIALSNDNNEIVVLTIQSPYEPFSSHTEWSAKVITHFSILDPATDPLRNPSTFDEYLDQQRYISHLAWSPWSGWGNDRLQSVLAYSTNKEMRARNVFVSNPDHDPSSLVVDDNETTYQNISLRHAGPLKWCPQILNQDRMLLVAFSQDNVLCYDISAKDMKNYDISKHGLDERWDAISGVAFKIRSPDDVKMYFSSLLSTARAPTAALKLPLGRYSALATPSWQAQILESQALFSARHDLAGNAFTKTWGLASSPLGDLVATCISLHPSDMVEYLTPDGRSCTVTLSGTGDSGGKFILHSNGDIRDVSAETILFCIKRWFGNNSETDEIAAASKKTILQELLRSFGTYIPVVKSPEYLPDGIHIPGTEDPQYLIATLKQRVYFPTKTLQDRYQILVSTICSPDMPTEIQHLMITHRISQEVLALPDYLCVGSKLSAKILTIISIVLEKLLELGGNPVPQSSAHLNTEKCDICDSPVNLESLDWAKCAQGHQFARCGLSFLAIQAPGISNFCGICKKQFLSKEYIMLEDQIIRDDTYNVGAEADVEVEDAATENRSATKEKSQANGRRQPLSLARLLFAACDVCIYCGGKFVG